MSTPPILLSLYFFSEFFMYFSLSLYILCSFSVNQGGGGYLDDMYRPLALRYNLCSWNNVFHFLRYRRFGHVKPHCSLLASRQITFNTFSPSRDWCGISTTTVSWPPTPYQKVSNLASHQSTSGVANSLSICLVLRKPVAVMSLSAISLPRSSIFSFGYDIMARARFPLFISSLESNISIKPPLVLSIP